MEIRMKTLKRHCEFCRMAQTIAPLSLLILFVILIAPVSGTVYNYTNFTASGNFTVPSDAAAIDIFIVGPGGAGGDAGGGGGYTITGIKVGSNMATTLTPPGAYYVTLLIAAIAAAAILIPNDPKAKIVCATLSIIFGGITVMMSIHSNSWASGASLIIAAFAGIFLALNLHAILQDRSEHEYERSKF